ncbi:MAG TPA: succinyl-diaminopimelate desuccinylase [Micromonosporaceae bacterium]|nr:succinyl-diaminopimelate desuccinylase [Micromonosporaceae bacterium]
MTLTPDILADPVALTRVLVDIQSVSGNEREITDAVESALRSNPGLRVSRDGNVVLARTNLGRPRRVVLAGHLDTVPVADNLPSRLDGDLIHGCGTADMKAGVAVALHLAVTLTDPSYETSYLFYDCEEVESERNGLNRIARQRPDWLRADFALLLEPTYGLVEAGCQGTIRVAVRVEGVRAHSARGWLGVNAIHATADVLDRLRRYHARTVDIDGCVYREGLNAVQISGGVAGNVIPDECTVAMNYRFAPDRDEAAALAHLQEVFDGYAVELVDSAPGALPGLAAPVARRFLAAVGQPARAKLGWTDVSRFAALGVPALNFGPGDPDLAHKPEERVEIPRIRDCAEVLRRWLTKETIAGQA